MAYCHECGSEVAQNDVFCPYCGITLRPIQVGGEDDAFSETIAINSEDKIEIPPVAETAKESVADASLAEASSDETAKTDLNENPDELSTGMTSENINLKTESVEIPAEMFDEVNSSGEEEISAESANETVQNEEESKPDEEYFPPLPDIPTLLNEESQSSASSASSVVETGSAADVSAAPDDEANIEPEEIETQADEASNLAANEPDSPEISIDETELDETPPLADSETEEEDLSWALEDEAVEESGGVIAETESSADSSVQTPIENQDISNQALVDEPISMPEAELQEPERPARESIFDSVQIVQKEEMEKEPAAEVEAEAPKQEAAGLPQEHKEGRSFTTPNIAGGDTDGKGSSKLKPLDEGTVLNGRYEIIRKIGGGGMGAVYLASDKNLGGVLRAVKEMVQSYIEETQQEKAIADFKRESMLLTSLEHQAIPTIYDYFYSEKEARFYLVMKYISGGDLSSRLRSSAEGRIDEKSVTEWAIQIADVLDYLHNRQPPIVYRDLKPANIMIDGNTGRVMLIDFGIARWINKEEKGVTAVGTMGYAPPELFSGNVEPRSDVYSLGSTMFHLLTGADPQSNPLLIFDFQKHPRPRQINSQLSDQMERILMRAVEYNSNKRFASAAEMRDALQEHLKNLIDGRITYGVKEVAPVHAFPEQPVFCGFCGQKIVASDLFCAFCGSKQPLAGQGASVGVYAKPQTAKLTIVGTTELDSPSFTLEKDDNLVGRRDPMSNIFPEIDLSKFDPQTKISRRHARIWREGNNFMVEDLGSSNGTVLQPLMKDTIRLLPHQPHVLTSGDKLRLGDTTMHFIIG